MPGGASAEDKSAAALACGEDAVGTRSSEARCWRVPTIAAPTATTASPINAVGQIRRLGGAGHWSEAST